MDSGWPPRSQSPIIDEYMPDPFDPYPALGTLETDVAEYDHTETDAPRDVLATPEEPRAMRALSVAALLMGAILSFRLLDLQIVQGTKNQVLAEGNRIRTREIRPPRGEIRDRTGLVLADNFAGYTLEIYPAELPSQRSEWEGVLARVQAITGRDTTETAAVFAQTGLLSLEPVTLAADIERETALVWQAKLAELPGVAIVKTPQRTYLPDRGLGHILGYVGRLSAEDAKAWPDRPLTADVGKSGMERTYEERLGGTPGQKRIEVDARGRVERVLAEVAPTQGETLTLTLDARLQASLVRHLTAATEQRAAPGAAAVVLDVRTGGVLAMASLPGFDPNVFVASERAAERQALLSDDRRPLLNRATDGVYPSGSTIKPVIAAAALAEGTITPTTQLDTSAGVIEIGQWRFPDWKVHGTADVRRAIAESNDIFFYSLGGGWQHIPGLGPDRLKKWLAAFGFGAATGIDLPTEGEGLVPDDTWKRGRFGEGWYIGDSYHLAIGQGFFLTTPLQLARATAVIANGGSLITPHLAAAVQNAEATTPESLVPTTTNRVPVSEATLAIIREGMRQTITDGTARSLGELPVAIAGKTGTAQFGPVVDGKPATHSWFTGFAPADNPEIAIAVIVEGGGESSDAAVPAAKEFFRDWAASRTPIGT